VITLEPLLGLIEAAVALILIFFSKRVSVGSIIAALLLPLLSYLFDPRYLPWTAVMAVIVLFKHRANFVRLLKGEEPKVSFSKQEEKNE
jgi:glycerol-3-phosphate acyltransferase PlsY